VGIGGAGERGSEPLCPCLLAVEDRLHCCFSTLGGWSFLRIGFSAHFDAVSIVHELVEDAVGDSGVADLLVPAGDRQLEVRMVERVW
jgi:hypothetical protein